MMARFPAPMSGWSAVIPPVVDTIIAALAPAMPDRVPAGHHGLLGGAVVFFGVHPQTGKRFVVQSLEGGGWGDPLERDPEAVRHDVVEELISAHAAFEDYGVVLDGRGNVDLAATGERRSLMAK